MSKKMDRIYAIRQQMAVAAGRAKRSEIAVENGTVPPVKIDRNRITLAKLRFMGEEPPPRHETTEIEGALDE